MILRIVTEATGEPVSVQEVRDHLRIESTEEDYLLMSYIKAARLYAENYCKRAFMPQQWMMVLDDFSDTMELPRPPLSSNSTDIVITYRDTSGNTQTLGSSVYEIDYLSEPGRINIAYDMDWPDVYTPQRNNVTITYRCGYPLSTNSTVTTPELVKHWIKVRVGQMYEYREPLVTTPNLNSLSHSYIDGLLDPHVVIKI